MPPRSGLNLPEPPYQGGIVEQIPAGTPNPGQTAAVNAWWHWRNFTFGALPFMLDTLQTLPE